MLKKFSCLALLGMAFSLNAMEPSSTNTSASALKSATFEALTQEQQDRLFSLHNCIEKFLNAYSENAKVAHGVLLECLKWQVNFEIPAPFITHRRRGGALSINEKVQALIEENQEELSEFTANGTELLAPELVEQRARLQEVKRLLDAHVAQASADKSAPKGGETRRGGPGKSNPRKDRFFSGITRNHVLITLGVLGVSYVVWKKFLTTSDEDEK